ncbi:MAG TPA: TadE family protein [bacterium]|nr:TadE family protein [bacterium]
MFDFPVRTTAGDNRGRGRARLRRLLRDTEGQTLLETVIVFPVLLFFLLVVMELSMMYNAKQLANYAAFCAARAAAVYDKRLPGNFGLAIDFWKKALARLAGTNRDGVQRLVASAEGELARQFSADSADAFVLLKQGKRDEAVALLEKMRADYLDINAPQCSWASKILARRRH